MKETKKTVTQRAKDRLEAFCMGALVMAIIAVIVVVIASLHYMMQGSTSTMAIQRVIRAGNVATPPMELVGTYEKGCKHLKVVNSSGERVDIVRLDIQEVDETGSLSVVSYDLRVPVPEDACVILGTIAFQEASSTLIKAYCRGYETPVIMYIDWQVEFTPKGELAATKTEEL